METMCFVMLSAMNVGGWIAVAVGVLVLVLVIILMRWIFSLRRVVSPNEVHVVRQGKKTLVYGRVEKKADSEDTAQTNASANAVKKETSAGNSYYQWPVWLPGIGVNVTVLPLSVFSINLDKYSAYDRDRLPFVVDIQAYFRISDYEIAASRIPDFRELKTQLLGILQGASRSLLANEVLEEIMGKRAEYGDKFTGAVKQQLASWGVVTVKNIELMDIRDADGEEVIENIMKKKKSEIEKDSRVTVAKNRKEAETAEIETAQAIEMRQQEKDETVGKRKAEVDASVRTAQEKAEQGVQDERKATTEKTKAVQEVEATRDAEIKRAAEIINADTSKQQTIILAEGQLQAARQEAEGTRIKGEASADAEKAIQMASVSAQIALAKEIGENESYQKYLLGKQQIEATQAVGIEQAKNLTGANIKIIAGAGGVNQGITDAASALSPQGGLAIGGMLEAFASTDEGQKFLSSLEALMHGVKTGKPNKA